jgi:hypothetical protein
MHGLLFHDSFRLWATSYLLKPIQNVAEMFLHRYRKNKAPGPLTSPILILSQNQWVIGHGVGVGMGHEAAKECWSGGTLER